MEQQLTNNELLHAMKGIIKTEIQQSHSDILDAMQLFASDVDRRFDHIEQDVAVLKTDITSMRATMVTKSYLDDKFADEGARTGGQVRDTNLKVHSLTDALVAEGSLRSATSTRITMMNPFPRRVPSRK